MTRNLTLATALALCWMVTNPMQAQDSEKKSEKAGPPADVLKNSVDPYNPGSVRAAFLKASGVDTELDADEFKANSGKPGAFAQVYDRWSTLLLFDKNKDKKIDWFEANAYRRAARTAVLGVYDKNKNRKLSGEERDEANKALAAGKLPKVTVTRAGTTGSNLGSGSQPTRPRSTTSGRDSGRTNDPGRDARRAEWNTLQAEMVKKYDADGNGRLNGDEWTEARGEIRDFYRKREIERYDSNGDGEVSDDERRAGREKERAAELKRRYDEDRDGELNGDEQAKYDAALAESRDRRAFEEERRKVFMTQFDKDGDGDLSEDERAAIGPYFEQRRESANKVAIERFDSNGDGELNSDERRAGRETLEKARLEKWDKNGDGELSSAERLDAFRNRDQDAEVSDYGLLRSLGGGRRNRGRGGQGGGDRGGRGGNNN